MSQQTCVVSERLIEYVQRNFPQTDLDLIRRACAFAQEHYADLVHPTGNLYIQYTLTVAEYLVEIGSEPPVIAAALICPPPPVERKVLDALKKDFKGANELLELVEKIHQISYLEGEVWPSVQAQSESRERKDILHQMFLLAIDEMKNQTQEQNFLTAVHFQKKERQLENLIRMFLAAATDLRAFVIKLVDRLHFIKYLKDLPPSRQQSMDHKLLAKITLAIYAPIADRLGMWRLKSELEDMSFRLLEPDTYKAIARRLDLKKQERESYIAHIIPALQEELKAYGIEAEIFGRAKHIYSIYKKMEAAQLTFNEINDLLGVRIIVDSYDDCYNAQSVLHEYWPPLTDTYEGKAGRDWIANPKENLYQSLHTTILFVGRAVEVQIRTSAMHKIAEYGVTALQDAVHWRYKESKTYRKAKTNRQASEKYRSRQLAELHKILNSNQERGVSILQSDREAVISMLKDLLKDRIFVITPKGHVINLPVGATPLDFAYRIHTDLGHGYAGAKVGDNLVRIDYELKNGDIVELIPPRARKGPSPEWLSVGKDEDGKRYYLYARTRQARSKIINWLNKHDEEYKSRHNEMQKPKTQK
jgi:guanosine-3',5'-bis(diphosphate) 3'-pyrophosphohydrolase